MIDRARPAPAAAHGHPAFWLVLLAVLVHLPIDEEPLVRAKRLQKT